MTAQETIDKQEVYREAHARFCQSSNWVQFYREVLGTNGIVRRAFPDRAQMAAFEATEEYTQIQQMLARLRERGLPPNSEETRVITVRLPKSLHEALRAEAHAHQTSMNKLCITKLLQFIDNELVPAEK